MNENTHHTAEAALVTGGGRGIGAAVAVRLAEAGFDVALTYERDEQAAAEVVSLIEKHGRRGLALRADASDADAVTGAVDRAAAEFGRLDVLVNNAAVFPVGPHDGHTVEEIDRVLAVNVRAPFLASRAAARHMDGDGRIVTVGSNVATRVPFGGLTLYTLSKSALAGMTRGLARDLGPRGITVAQVDPGPTDTDTNPADGPNADGIRSLVPLGRFARPAEIAETVAHLVGPGGRFITGAVLPVDGGINA
ncbi:SDR family NAD(P)-dependent oxidoreductase [Nocardiopsis changdeensis]|uniref:SDR family oxidoreductase n=1 Tax=Nocardiopsis changdeensis TaxID=2831969 RepID=A0ABX8BMK4_9ACTN|nr:MULTISPECIES: SDR family oxidoreductase [Nocardiopsis]QUX22544.1 SDR family oxidoreductase [Nocardiopsis changdeensis]QYX38485.1 SDR family oxidoreductase [Nocardiopsis sp. MT53]